MEIQKKYLSKYFHDIAIEQIADEYTQKGYTVNKEEKIGNFNADIIARKGNEQIIIEVKSGVMTPKTKERIAKLADYVRELGSYKFLVVVATPPKEKKIEIVGIEELILSYLVNNFPDELMRLSTHTLLEDIYDVNIDEVIINNKVIKVKGIGIAGVDLQYGSYGEQERGDGFRTNDNFSFKFEVTLEYDEKFQLTITNTQMLEFDTNSFYS